MKSSRRLFFKLFGYWFLWMVACYLTAMLCAQSVGATGRQAVGNQDRLIKIYTARDAVLEDHLKMIETTRAELLRETENLQKMVQVSLDLYSESKKMLGEAKVLNKKSLNRTRKAVTHR